MPKHRKYWLSDNVHCLHIPIFNTFVYYPFHLREAIADDGGAEARLEPCALLKWVSWNTWDKFILLQEILTEHIWHCFLASPSQKPKQIFRGGKHVTWPSAIPVLFLLEQSHLQKNREVEIPLWGCLLLSPLPQDFLQASVFCSPLPRSIQASIRRTGACMVCSHCTPVVFYSGNVVKHLRESMTNSFSNDPETGNRAGVN